MPPAIPEGDRQRILDLHAQGRTRNDIAREVERSPSTVSKVCTEAGLSFDRTDVKRATEAKVADIRAVRAKLIAEMVAEDIPRLRERAWGRYETTVPGIGIVELRRPPLGETRNAYVSIGVILDKSMQLDRHDADQGAEGARSVVGALADALRVAADRLNTPE